MAVACPSRKSRSLTWHRNATSTLRISLGNLHILSFDVAISFRSHHVSVSFHFVSFVSSAVVLPSPDKGENHETQKGHEKEETVGGRSRAVRRRSTPRHSAFGFPHFRSAPLIAKCPPLIATLIAKLAINGGDEEVAVCQSVASRIAPLIARDFDILFLRIR